MDQAASRRTVFVTGASGFNATILRPWYVLGPGRRWPLLVSPIHWTLERLPATRESARRLGLVTLEQMVSALANAVDHPARGIRILDLPRTQRADLGPEDPKESEESRR